jgi:hypothetical protein
VHGNATAFILVAIPAADPSILIGSSALEDGIGGVHNVLNGQLCEHTTVLLASLHGSLVRNSGNGEEFMIMVAYFVLAILLLMATLLVILLVVLAMSRSKALVSLLLAAARAGR